MTTKVLRSKTSASSSNRQVSFYRRNLIPINSFDTQFSCFISSPMRFHSFFRNFTLRSSHSGNHSLSLSTRNSFSWPLSKAFVCLNLPLIPDNSKGFLLSTFTHAFHFRYPLLISRICKATPKRNTDREKLKMAQRKIEEQLNKINAVSRNISREDA